MDQGLALEIMLSGKSVLLTGSAGAGKTFVLNKFIKQARGLGKHVSVTATTGLAATHLGGSTIHSWSGIGVNDYLRDGFLESMSKSRRETIEKTDILIIDEISMLHDFRFDMIDEVCRRVRKNDRPFGGIQVIVSGDFFQLPPINRSSSRQGGFVITSSVWQDLDPTICYINEQHRQDDDELLEILNAMRAGDLRRGHVEKLLSRVDQTPDDENITELHTINRDVDYINERKLDVLPGETTEYTQTTTGSANYVDSLGRSVLAPGVLRLKPGALVMTVKNSLEHKYVNGSVGTVVDFETDTNYPVVEFKNGRVMTILPDTWELRDGDRRRASITQVPLRLAWAITVHKSQGMTLDSAKIDLRKAFVEGMGYVALSRVKNLSNLYLLGINKMALQVSREARAIDRELREKASGDEKQFAYLREQAEKRRKGELDQIKIKKKPASSWQEKIAKMRETYPNAYKPWTHEQDEFLKEKFINGVGVKELSKQLGRHTGSILARLKKNFGEEISI